MIRHYFGTLVRGHRRDPTLFSIVQSGCKTIQPLFEKSAVIRSKLDELAEDFLRDDLAVLRIHPIMRVSKRMNVTFSPGNLTLRHFQNSCLKRGIQITV